MVIPIGKTRVTLRDAQRYIALGKALLAPEAGAYVLLLSATAIQVLLGAVMPLYMRAVINLVILPRTLRPLVPLLSFALATTLVSLLLREACSRLGLHMHLRVRGRLLLAFLHRIPDVSLGAGDVGVTFSTDVGKVMGIVTSVPEDILEGVVRLGFVAAVTWSADPYLLLVAAVLFALQNLLQNRIVLQRARLRRASIRSEAAYLQLLEEAARDPDAYRNGVLRRNARALAGRRLQLYSRLSDMDWRAKVANAAIGNTSSAVTQWALMAFLAVTAVQGRIGVGTLVALLTYFSTLNAPLGTLRGAVLRVLADGPHFERVLRWVSVADLSEGVHVPDPITDPGELHPPYTVRLRDVAVRDQSGARAPILRVREVQFGPGGVHEIVGPNGSGKTSVASLLAGSAGGGRFTGEVVVHDGRGMALNRALCVAKVGAHTALTSGSLLANVMRGAAHPGSARRMIRLAFSGEPWGDRLPDGEMTRLGTERGLSRGEDLYVSVVRALASRPAVLILDDVLGNVDVGLRDRLLGLAVESGCTVLLFGPEELDLGPSRSVTRYAIRPVEGDVPSYMLDCAGSDPGGILATTGG